MNKHQEQHNKINQLFKQIELKLTKKISLDKKLSTERKEELIGELRR